MYLSYAPSQRISTKFSMYEDDLLKSFYSWLTPTASIGYDVEDKNPILFSFNYSSVHMGSYEVTVKYQKMVRILLGFDLYTIAEYNIPSTPPGKTMQFQHTF